MRIFLEQDTLGPAPMEESYGTIVQKVYEADAMFVPKKQHALGPVAGCQKGFGDFWKKGPNFFPERTLCVPTFKPSVLVTSTLVKAEQRTASNRLGLHGEGHSSTLAQDQPILRVGARGIPSKDPGGNALHAGSIILSVSCPSWCRTNISFVICTLMDTSMDDLFADMDRSNQAAVEMDHPVKEDTSENYFFRRFRAFDEEIKIKIWRHEDLSNALVYEISMNYHNATVGQPLQFVSPWCSLFSGSSAKLYPSWPPVQPCALVCKTNFHVDQNKVSLPVFPLSSRWQNLFRLHLQAGSDSIPVVWLISFSNGAVYYFVRDAEIRYALLFSPPCCEPMSLWSVIESPIMTRTSSTLPSPAPNDLVVALSGSGCGAAIWLCSEDKHTKQMSSVGSPTDCSSDAEEVTFYGELSGLIRKAKSTDTVILTGDMHAQLGRLSFLESHLGGRFADGARRTDNGDLLLQLCADHELFYRPPTANQPWNQLNHVAVSHRLRAIIQDCRSSWGTPLDSDHTMRRCLLFHPDCSELRVTDFRTPVAPSPVCDIQTHGSWLHLVTTSGHVLSLHISCCRGGASQTGDEWRLICQPGNFPRVPTHMIPAISATDQLQLVPKWRYFDLRGFVRMSDGHLGGRLSTGEKIRLVDLLCGNETAEPQGNGYLGSLNSTVNTLINVHCRLRAYRALLQLLGFLDVDDLSPKLSTGPEAPLRRLVSVKMQTSLVTNAPVSSIEDSPFELSAIVSLEAPPAQMNNSLTPATPLQSLSAEELASLLLHPESRTSSFERELFLVMRLTPLTFSAMENHLKQDSTGLPIFTYSEPWFSSCHQWTRVDTSKSHVFRRQMILPSNWHTCIKSSKSPKLFDALRLDVSLELLPPSLPTSLFTADLCGQMKRPVENSCVINAPPLRTSIGDFHLDRILWLYPLDQIPRVRQKLGQESEYPSPSSLTLAYSVDSLHPLKSLFSDICKSCPHASLVSLSKYDSNGLSDKEVESAIHLNEQLISYFVPTEQCVVFSWRYVTSHGPERPTKLSIELSVSAKCSYTLWLVHESLQRRLQPSVTKVRDPSLPSVEVLRQEYSVLKSMEDSLKQRSYSLNDVDNLKKFRTLLQVFSTVRNTTTVRSMLSRTPAYLAMTTEP
ncbi:hypothetical protein T265_07528 [Opisthorchis viverrini]|uniref:Uncharacterized protein n=1 Tax=Opisthorchis viverrini TaxID=6198 RepID=A0A075AB95_OPIVI|nr:hypothetical protein T265_07528 [Opisthorchis viverrini]KER24904.1 hypothetical protein T265_07528 [Opisthorchis viverrini]